MTAILTNEVLEETLPLIRRYLENEAQSSRRQFDEIKETCSSVQTELQTTRRIVQELQDLMEDPPSCESGWVYHYLYCYKFIQTYVNYQQGQARCQSMNAYVADVTSEQEHGFIKAELLKLKPVKPNWDIYFLGGQRNRTINEWIWKRTGKKFGFTKWDMSKGEPNDSNKTEDCLQTQRHRDFLWNDVPCSFKANVICKKSVFNP